MRKEDVTKEFLKEISQPENLSDGVSTSMVFLFTRDYKAMEGLEKYFKVEPVVEPEKFFERLDEAIEKITPGATVSFVNKIAKKIKDSILCDMIQVPTYINDPHVRAIARWRLRNGI